MMEGRLGFIACVTKAARPSASLEIGLRETLVWIQKNVPARERRVNLIALDTTLVEELKAFSAVINENSGGATRPTMEHQKVQERQALCQRHGDLSPSTNCCSAQGKKELKERRARPPERQYLKFQQRVLDSRAPQRAP